MRSLKSCESEESNTNAYKNIRTEGGSRVDSERCQVYTMIATGYSEDQLPSRVGIEGAAG